MAHYDTEREGRLDFYRTFLPLVDPSIEAEGVPDDYNDGVLNGNLLEFKLHASDLNAHLFQCVKYLSARRMKGKPVPKNIFVVDLSAGVAHHYESTNYLEYIEKIYPGPASKNNEGFPAGSALEKLEYEASDADAATFIELLREDKYTKTHIDENCIVGWATRYYCEKQNARKEDFIGDGGKRETIGEIRNPTHFAKYILPYMGTSNVKFEYLMDRLNDTFQRKNLGAFYTPEPYAEKSHKLLRKAIGRVPEGNDYVIIDRCAGTGNLERGLTDEELSHCILSTVEYYEYKVMQEILGPKVRNIIPPRELDDTFDAGLVRGADALSKEYLENEVIRKYVDNPKCTIILFENPPYSESTSIEHQRKGAGGKSSIWKSSHVAQEMKKEIKGTALNDLGNAFIWSAFKYYLRQDTDSYIVYSPVKYWKAQHLINKRFVSGYAFNRRHFHTKIDACIMCALWTNEHADLNRIELEAFDIDKEDRIVNCEMLLPVSRVYSMFSRAYYDKRKFVDDEPGIIAEFDGTESSRKPQGISPVFNPNILGYLTVKGNNFDNPDSSVHLLRVGEYDGHGFYLRRDNYLEKLPMFCASRYVTYNRQWTERARVMKSADGADRFESDVASGKLDQWLRKCLLFTCVEMQNHIRTFTGSDGRFYRNELCMDTTNGPTVASRDLEELDRGPGEERILNQWELLMDAVKRTDEYDPTLTYGIYQVFDEIDTSYKDDEGNTVWNNIEVHSSLQALKALVKKYYNTEIVPMLFEYEFLK